MRVDGDRLKMVKTMTSDTSAGDFQVCFIFLFQWLIWSRNGKTKLFSFGMHWLFRLQFFSLGLHGPWKGTDKTNVVEVSSSYNLWRYICTWRAVVHIDHYLSAIFRGLG